MKKMGNSQKKTFPIKRTTMKRPMLLLRLPTDVFRKIQEDFLTACEYMKFCNTSKKLRRIKRETIILDLNNNFSMKYYKYQPFRNRVNEGLACFNKQLCLQFFTNHEISNLLPFEDIYKLDIYRCSNATNFECLGKGFSFVLIVSFSQFLLVRLNVLGKLHTLKVFGSSLNDVTGLGDIYDLWIELCSELRDISPLGNNHRLHIINCPISNVNNLKNVHTLTLSNCQNLKDVSMLGRVHSLDLSGSLQFTDIRSLGNVRKLNLSKCSQIIDVSGLGNVHDLDLSYCSQITDVSALGNIYRLNLSRCLRLEDISELGKKNIFLNLSYCPEITSVNHLTSVYSLNIMKCSRVYDLSNLSLIKELNISHNSFLDISSLRSVRILDISWCIDIKGFDIKLFPFLKKLMMYGCYDLYESLKISKGKNKSHYHFEIKI
jgi:hypothetical protein